MDRPPKTKKPGIDPSRNFNLKNKSIITRLSRISRMDISWTMLLNMLPVRLRALNEDRPGISPSPMVHRLCNLTTEDIQAWRVE